MSKLVSLIHCAGKLARNMGRLVTGRPLYIPELTAMTLEEDDLRLVDQLLREPGRWQRGEPVSQFQEEFGRWNGSRFAYAFMGGRVALTACIRALGLQAGDEVVIPGYTCVVVRNAFAFEGIRIVYADIELDTYGLDYQDLVRKTGKDTKAILLHHLYGLVARDTARIVEFAASRGIKVIEDCAHATGATLDRRRVGNFGDLAFYSFEISKVITTFSGGMAVTNDPVLAGRLAAVQGEMALPSPERIERLLLNVKYHHLALKHRLKWLLADLAFVRYKKAILLSTVQEEMEGAKPAWYEQTMPAPLARLGLNQLKKIDALNGRRTAAADRWGQWADAHGFGRPVVIEGSRPVFLRYPVLVAQEMKQDQRWAEKLDIVLGEWFVSQLHPVPGRIEGCPNAEIAVARCINFPTLLR